MSVQELKKEIEDLQKQKEQLQEDIDGLEKKYQTVYQSQINGKITLPCQTQMHINPDFHLVMDKRWVVNHVRIFAMLELDFNGVMQNRLRLNNQVNLGFTTYFGPQNFHFVELYDRRSNTQMLFE